jgi:ribosomal-protein-alanine N-acetyltransferase
VCSGGALKKFKHRTHGISGCGAQFVQGVLLGGGPSGMKLELREYQEKDFERLYALDHACFPKGIAYSRWMLGYFLRMPQARCFVAVEGEATPGFIITEEAPPLGHVLTLDVAESHRRTGLGTRLLERSESELAARGVTEMTLETGIDNVAGVAFWKRHGYTTVGTLKRYYLGRLDAYEMRKKLGEPPGT